MTATIPQRPTSSQLTTVGATAVRWSNHWLIRTGDILLLTGNENIQQMIKLGTNDSINHVGMAVWIKNNTEHGLSGSNIVLTSEDDAQLFVYESNNDYQYDVITGMTKDGVRLTPITVYLRHQEIVKLQRIDFVRTQQFYLDLFEWMIKNAYRSYESSYLKLFGSLFSRTLDSRTETVFCSELMAEYLYDFGLLPESQKAKYPPNAFMPGDFNRLTYSSKLFPKLFKGDPVVVLYLPENAPSFAPIYFAIGLILAFGFYLIFFENALKYLKGE